MECLRCFLRLSVVIAAFGHSAARPPADAGCQYAWDYYVSVLNSACRNLGNASGCPTSCLNTTASLRSACVGKCYWYNHSFGNDFMCYDDNPLEAPFSLQQRGSTAEPCKEALFDEQFALANSSNCANAYGLLAYQVGMGSYCKHSSPSHLSSASCHERCRLAIEPAMRSCREGDIAGKDANGADFVLPSNWTLAVIAGLPPTCKHYYLQRINNSNNSSSNNNKNNKNNKNNNNAYTYANVTDISFTQKMPIKMAGIAVAAVMTMASEWR